MPKIAIGEAELYYERHGSGPPLLLVSGLGGQGSYWRNQLPALTPHFGVILHDHRGCGRSSHTRMRYSVEQMAADVLALMDALGTARAHYLGHSTGGAMGQVLALDHPERISKLVLSATWPKADAFFRRSFAIRKRVLLELGIESYVKLSNLWLYPDWWIAEHDAELAAQEAAAIAAAAPAEITASRIDAICAFDRREQLARIRIPTLVIAAADDRVTPLYHSRDLAKRIPGAQLVELPGGGHFAPHAEAEAYNRAVLDFLLGGTQAGVSIRP
jgi:aminoacrylate hydrolase